MKPRPYDEKKKIIAMYLRRQWWGRERAQQVKTLASRTGNQSERPRTHTTEEHCPDSLEVHVLVDKRVKEQITKKQVIFLNEKTNYLIL